MNASLEKTLTLFAECLGEGWYEVGDNGVDAWVWSGPRAVVRVPEGAVLLDFICRTEYPKWTGRPQTVRAWVDGERRRDFVCDGPLHTLQLRCKGASEIVFEVDSVKPSDLGLSDDERPLGLQLNAIIPVSPSMPHEEYLDVSTGYLRGNPSLRNWVLGAFQHKREEARLVLERLRPELEAAGDAPRVLDCGSGNGDVAICFEQAGMRATALDLSETFLARARSSAVIAGTPIRIVRGDGQRLCFATGAFDVALGLDIMEHVPDPAAMLREIRRVLKPEGLFVLRTGFAWNPRNVRRDPHCHVPLAVLMPRPLRQWWVVTVWKRATELEDFVWFRSFASLRRFARRNGLVLELMHRRSRASMREEMRAATGPKAAMLRAACAALPFSWLENLYATWTDAYCVARPLRK